MPKIISGNIPVISRYEKAGVYWWTNRAGNEAIKKLSLRYL